MPRIDARWTCDTRFGRTSWHLLPELWGPAGRLARAEFAQAAEEAAAALGSGCGNLDAWLDHLRTDGLGFALDSAIEATPFEDGHPGDPYIIYKGEIRDVARWSAIAARRLARADSLPAAIKLNKRKPRGTAAEAILCALNAHHKYDGTSILNHNPIGIGQLAKQAGRAKSTVSKWFVEKFANGHDGYQVGCMNGSLLHFLKLLNGDYTPRAVSRAADDAASADEE
jgi:hypothetical protein